MKDFMNFIHDYRGAIIGRNTCNNCFMYGTLATSNKCGSNLCWSIFRKLCTTKQR